MSVAAHRFDNAKRRRLEAHERQRYLTPPYVLEPVRRLLGGIELDPCTQADNPTGASMFYCPPQEGRVLPRMLESYGSTRHTANYANGVRDSPRKRQTTGAILFGEALANVWPCK